MANLKNAAIREIVLDRCLRDHRRKYSTKDLMDACNRALSLEGYKEVTSLNTIRSDMRSIEHRWFEYGGIIEEEVVGRNKYYHYKNPTFSIYKTDLSQDDLNKLNQTLAVLSRFRGLPQFEWIDELNARFKSTFMSTPNTKTIISFDENIDAEGKQYISTLLCRSAALLPLSPLRTVRATFTAYSSDNSKFNSHKIKSAHNHLVMTCFR